MTSDDVITGEAPVRYAAALIGLAEEAKSLESVEKDMAALAAAIETSEDLRRVSISPAYATDDKVAAFDAIAAKMKLSDLSRRFVGTVVANRRAEDLPAIIEAFRQAVALRRGTQVAKVTSAAPLTAAQTKKLAAKLKSITGQSVEFDARVDPDLLGGFRVKLGSRLFDATLKTKLEDMRLALRS